MRALHRRPLPRRPAKRVLRRQLCRRRLFRCQRRRRAPFGVRRPLSICSPRARQVQRRPQRTAPPAGLRRSRCWTRVKVAAARPGRRPPSPRSRRRIPLAPCPSRPGPSTKLDEARQAVDETASLSAVARSDDVPGRSFAARGRTALLVSSLDKDRITGGSLASSRRGLAGAEPAGSLLAREWIEEHKLEHQNGAARPMSGSAALSTALGGSGSDAVSMAVARAAEARRRAEGLMSSDTARPPPWRRTDAR